MLGNLTRINFLGGIILLVACNTPTDGEGLLDERPAEVVEEGKADDYFGSISAEYDLQTTVQVRLEGEDAALEGEERLARARELALEEMEQLTSAVDDKIWEDWTEDDRTGDNAIMLRQMSDTLDELHDEGEGVYSFGYLVEVAGPSDLLQRYPFGDDDAGLFLEVTVGSGDDARIYRLDVTTSEATPDSYPEYMEMFEGGLDIAVHIGDDHNGDWIDIAQAESVFDALRWDLGFDAPVGTFEDLGLNSGAFTRQLDVNGQMIDVRVTLFHADMVDDEHLDELVLAYELSASYADVVIYSGHAGRTLTYSGVVVHYGPRASVPASEFQNLELPEQYQIFLFAGCETYTGYSESLFAHEGKTSRNADVVTTVNYSTSLPHANATITLITGLLEDAQGTWWPLSWSSLLERMNDGDAGHRWTAMYGVHGLGDNPRSSPLGELDTVGASCEVNSHCPGIDNRCNSLDQELQCGVACTDETGCPDGSDCMMVDIGLDDPHHQCIMR